MSEIAVFLRFIVYFVLMKIIKDKFEIEQPKASTFKQQEAASPSPKVSARSPKPSARKKDESPEHNLLM